MPPSPPPAFFSDSAPKPLRLRPEIAELAILSDYIEAFALEHDLPAADANAITLAAEELFANTIGHSDPPASVVEFSLVSDGPAITAVYADDAATFDPTAYPEADTTLPLDRRPVGGLGIHFIRRTMQTFAYRRVDGRNQITFGRSLSRKAS
jgi:anti-sigma regulatory factor (Ser/Thr protein kinase)